MQAIGTALAKMHGNTIVHGDLTTSNMMLRPLPGQTPKFEVVSDRDAEQAIPRLPLLMRMFIAYLSVGAHRLWPFVHVHAARNARRRPLRP